MIDGYRVRETVFGENGVCCINGVFLGIFSMLVALRSLLKWFGEGSVSLETVTELVLDRRIPDGIHLLVLKAQYGKDKHRVARYTWKSVQDLPR